MSTELTRDLLKIIREKEEEIWKLKNENQILKLKMFDMKTIVKYGPPVEKDLEKEELKIKIRQLEKENFQLTISLEKDGRDNHGEWLSSLERLAMIATQDTDDPFFNYSRTNEDEDLEIINEPKVYKKWEFFPDGSSTSGMR